MALKVRQRLATTELRAIIRAVNRSESQKPHRLHNHNALPGLGWPRTAFRESRMHNTSPLLSARVYPSVHLQQQLVRNTFQRHRRRAQTCLFHVRERKVFLYHWRGSLKHHAKTTLDSRENGLSRPSTEATPIRTPSYCKSK